MSDQNAVSGGSLSGKKVVSVWISQLSRPDDRPLCGVTLEQVHEVFSKCGSIQKIICDAPSSDVGKQVQFIQVMVQYSTCSMAIAAVETLDGLSLTSDAFNKMRVHASLYDILAFGSSSGTPGPGETRSWMTYVPMEDVQKPHLTGSRYNHSLLNRKVIAIRIANLETPDQQPLAGFHVHDMYDLCIEFGPVEKVIWISNMLPWYKTIKMVVLVEFSQPEHSARALCRLHGRSLTRNQYHQMYVQMSHRTKLNVGSKSDFSWDYAVQPRPSGAQAALSATRREGTQAGRVLLVHVRDLKHPNLKPLRGLSIREFILGFKNAGPLEKLIVLDKSAANVFFVLAQFSSPGAAKTAEERLNGSSLTGNDNFKMSVTVSVKDELTLRPFTRLGWDFTRHEEAGLVRQPTWAPSDGCVKLVITSLRWPQRVSLPGGVHVLQVRAACEALGEVKQLLCRAKLQHSAVGAPKSLRCVEAIVEFKDAVPDEVVQRLSGKSLTQDEYNIIEVQEAEFGIGSLRENTTWCWDCELPPRPPFAAKARYTGEPVAEDADFGSAQRGVFFTDARRGFSLAWPEPLPLRERGFGADDEELGLDPFVAEALFTGSKADVDDLPSREADIDDFPSRHVYYSAASGDRGAWMSRTSRAPQCRNKPLAWAP